MKIYQIIVKLFLTVILNQFRKDVLRRMHRKQVRVSEPGKSASKTSKHGNADEQTPGTSSVKRKRKSGRISEESVVTDTPIMVLLQLMNKLMELVVYKEKENQIE